MLGRRSRRYRCRMHESASPVASVSVLHRERHQRGRQLVIAGVGIAAVAITAGLMLATGQFGTGIRLAGNTDRGGSGIGSMVVVSATAVTALAALITSVGVLINAIAAWRAGKKTRAEQVDIVATSASRLWTPADGTPATDNRRLDDGPATPNRRV